MSYTDTISITRRVEVTPELMDCLLEDCIAGIDYWARFEERLQDEGGNTWSIHFMMTEDHEGEFVLGYRFAVTAATFFVGLQRAFNADRTWSCGPQGLDPVQWDFDAEDLDVIVQYALFGDIIFG